MIRLGKEEYFIEPLERGEKAERGKGRGQEHIVYRMSDIIKHPTAVNHTADDFKKGDTLHYLVLHIILHTIYEILLYKTVIYYIIIYQIKYY
jgi:hypothetical protein